MIPVNSAVCPELRYQGEVKENWSNSKGILPLKAYMGSLRLKGCLFQASGI